MSRYQRIQELRQERCKLAEQARQILDRTQQRGQRELTSEDDSRFERIHGKIEKLGREVQILERQADTEGELEDLDLIQESRASAGSNLNGALRRFAVHGVQGLKESERRELAPGSGTGHDMIAITPTARQRRDFERYETRAMSTSPTEGGEFIPEGFWPQIQAAMLAHGSVRQAARVIRTATGNDLPVPTVDDTGNAGSLIGENTQVSEQDVAAGAVTLEAFKYTSNLVRVSQELITDQAVNLEQVLGSLLGERIGRVTEAHYTTGTGSAQPRGVVTASALGHTAAAAGAISFDDILDLKHNVDPAYRRGPNSGFMLNDTTLSALKKLAIGASDARPLWQPGRAAGEPDTIDGSRYWVNQEMADIGTGNISVLFGDFSRYWIRDVAQLRLLRLVERYADFDQVGFILFLRTDADLITANAVRHLVHP